KNTLLALLASKFQSQFDQVSPTIIADEQVAKEAPKLVRYTDLPDYQQLEDSASEQIDFQLSAELQFKSLLGTLLHQYYEQEQLSPEQVSIKLRLIEAGFAQQDLSQQAKFITHMLKNTQNDPRFEWLFKIRESTRVEAEFVVDNHSIVIDRLFIDDDILWIIDFKTATLAEHESIEQFIERQKQAHSKQLLFYKQVLSGVYPNTINCALYCPSVQQIIEIN
ncbi:MAG: DNA helicase UvrD, partial [Candidatus Thioglobus sp.]|nr:DNA helicase UvrD [Candidatus Thioglobus sp.]